jgi:hypothetical protein
VSTDSPNLRAATYSVTAMEIGSELSEIGSERPAGDVITPSPLELLVTL